MVLKLMWKYLLKNLLRLKEIRRNLTGRTGCGLCGAESLDQVLKIPENKKNETNFLQTVY